MVAHLGWAGDRVGAVLHLCDWHGNLFLHGNNALDAAGIAVAPGNTSSFSYAGRTNGARLLGQTIGGRYILADHAAE